MAPTETLKTIQFIEHREPNMSPRSTKTVGQPESPKSRLKKHGHRKHRSHRKHKKRRKHLKDLDDRKSSSDDISRTEELSQSVKWFNSRLIWTVNANVPMQSYHELCMESLLFYFIEVPLNEVSMLVSNGITQPFPRHWRIISECQMADVWLNVCKTPLSSLCNCMSD